METGDTAAARFGMGDDECVIGFCAPDFMCTSFVTDLLSLLAYDAWTNNRIKGRYIGIRSGPLVERARNQISEHVYETKNLQWLLMVDTDMQFEPDSLDRLLESANPIERPVVGGLCFRYDTEIAPTMYRTAKNDTLLTIHHYTKGLTEVDATGAAFLLIHRSVLERLHQLHGPHWWTVEKRGDGEDVAFCKKVRAAGFPIYVDTRVEIGHLRYRAVGEKEYQER